MDRELPLSTQPHYFTAFFDRRPPAVSNLTPKARNLWHAAVGLTLGLGFWYLHWRWTQSLNPDAMVFSITVATAETLTFIGSLLFFFNIWDEKDTEAAPLPATRADLNLEGDGDIGVNIFITTYDEDVDLVAHSVAAAQKVNVPAGVIMTVYVADDGHRPEMRKMAAQLGADYLGRTDNRGFKAGNLANALMRTDADFIVICDADTQLFPNFLERTLAYFRDKDVAFVQTPHWFYDIPEGQNTADWLQQKFGRSARFLAPLVTLFSGRKTIGADPFLSGSNMFFDVIQRRRNRHNASFCCGAGSIHRTEAIFQNALEEQGLMLQSVQKKLGRDDVKGLMPRLDLQPFRFHVSEDIYTSLQQHTKGWRSVYHPEVLARMLSPWSMDAWATQKLKYAGGTLDIMLRSTLVWRSGLPWQSRLHYISTFWSYMSVLWMPILFCAPMIALVTGIAPVEAYSIEFFLHLIPVLLMNELAMSLGCKGHDIHAGRTLSIATLNIQLRAFCQVLMGKKPHFPPTPKHPVVSGSLRYAIPSLIVLAVMGGTAVYGLMAINFGSEHHSPSLVIVNLFWLGLNALAFLQVVFASIWRPRLPNGTLLSSAVEPTEMRKPNVA